MRFATRIARIPGRGGAAGAAGIEAVNEPGKGPFGESARAGLSRDAGKVRKTPRRAIGRGTAALHVSVRAGVRMLQSDRYLRKPGFRGTGGNSALGL